MPGPKYVTDFEFPSSFGFTGSSHDRSVTTVRSHERAKPQRFAKGGKVMQKPANPKMVAEKQKRLSVGQTVSGGIRRRREQALGLKKGGKVEVEVEVETKQRGGPVVKGHMRRSMPHLSTYEAVEGKSPHRHMKKGGSPPKKAHGGQLRYAGGGDVSQDERLISQAMTKHIRSPRPRGHGVK